MKTYFERVQKTGLDAIADLRRMDAQHTEMHRSYLEDRQRGNLTEQGFRSLVKALDDARAKKEQEIKALLNGIQREYEAAVDDYTAPSAAAMDSADIELLKGLELSVSEFDRLAEKHRDNPTMARFLDSYLKEHNVPTNWRYQGSDERKEIFARMLFGVESVIRASDKYTENREGRIANAVCKAYHKLQGSDPEVLALAQDEGGPESAADRMSGSGTVFF